MWRCRQLKLVIDEPQFNQVSLPATSHLHDNGLRHCDNWRDTKPSGAIGFGQYFANGKPTSDGECQNHPVVA